MFQATWTDYLLFINKSKRFWETHPTGRIENQIVDFNAEKGYIFVECRVYREYEDASPSAIDYAFGNVATYNVQMKRFFVEDTVTSAIGRAIGLLLGTPERPTRQDMEKVEHVEAKVVASTVDDFDPWATSQPVKSTLNEIASQLGGELVAAAPECVHGHGHPHTVRERARRTTESCNCCWLVAAPRRSSRPVPIPRGMGRWQ